MKQIIARIAEEKQVQAAVARFRAEQEANLALVRQIQQIPAPTFAEAQRADFVAQQMAAMGLASVAQDELHNVYGRFPGQSSTPPVVVSAHLDTVFPADTDLTVRQNGRLLYGPGIGDNATGVAGLLLLGQTLQALARPLRRDVWLVANVGEEGMGNLCGMTAVVRRFGPQASYIIVEGGFYGQISHQAIGVRRYRVTVNGPGGHSWGSFGVVSAIHVLARLIAAIDDLRVPDNPRTTYNVGVIEGGTSVNSIAQSAAFLLDLRSEDETVLAQLVDQVAAIIARVSQPYRAQGISVNWELVGNRPAGSIPRQTPLVALAAAALRAVGSKVRFTTGSTDANIPLSQGITAVCLGLLEAGHAHRLDEYIDPTFFPKGLSQLLLLTLAAADSVDY